MENNKRYYKQLTKREKTVIKLIAYGFDNKTIGEKMYVSTHTVKAFVAKILRKLEAKNRTNAVYIAFQIGILPDKDSTLKSA